MRVLIDWTARINPQTGKSKGITADWMKCSLRDLSNVTLSGLEFMGSASAVSAPNVIHKWLHLVI